MMTDCHAHLDEPSLSEFCQSLSVFTRSHPLRIISNSVEVLSSKRNIELSKHISEVIAFVGIHPKFVSSRDNMRRSQIETALEEIKELCQSASGIGEIGLDPKYGESKLQEYLLTKQLQVAESTGLPVSLHCRDSVSRLVEILSSYNLTGKVLFHWFAGSEAELVKVHQGGYFASFGPSILFSKRLAKLAESSEEMLVLAETDSPVRFESLLPSSLSTPFLISSVLFKMSLIRHRTFDYIVRLNNDNAETYLLTKS